MIVTLLLKYFKQIFSEPWRERGIRTEWLPRRDSQIRHSTLLRLNRYFCRQIRLALLKRARNGVKKKKKGREKWETRSSRESAIRSDSDCLEMQWYMQHWIWRNEERGLFGDEITAPLFIIGKTQEGRKAREKFCRDVFNGRGERIAWYVYLERSASFWKWKREESTQRRSAVRYSALINLMQRVLSGTLNFARRRLHSIRFNRYLIVAVCVVLHANRRTQLRATKFNFIVVPRYRYPFPLYFSIFLSFFPPFSSFFLIFICNAEKLKNKTDIVWLTEISFQSVDWKGVEKLFAAVH